MEQNQRDQEEIKHKYIMTKRKYIENYSQTYKAISANKKRKKNASKTNQTSKRKCKAHIKQAEKQNSKNISSAKAGNKAKKK